MVEQETSLNLNLNDSLYLSAEIMIGILTVCGNSLVLLTVYSSQNLHSTSNMFLCNLAAADICVGMFVAPSAMLTHYGIPSNYYGCVFLNCIVITFCDASILMLLVIAVDRFIAIRLPFEYQRIVSMNRVQTVNITVWVVSILLGIFPMIGWRHPPKEIQFCSFKDVTKLEYMVYIQFFGVVLTSFTAMLISNVYIFTVVRKHIQQIESIRDVLGLQPDQNFQRSYIRDLKTAKSLALMLVVFSHCWLPIGILNTALLYCNGCSFSPSMILMATSLSHANSFVNPLLYSTSNSSIRHAMWKLLFSDKDLETKQSSLEFISRMQTLHPNSARIKSSHSLVQTTCTASLATERDSESKGYAEYNLGEVSTTIF
ncbi:adenosine receptor A2a [Biomphalaria pfeifferi]|uniref:Adenosine receptor A2a n=1 Tax=Biomphalaria pfeifferi TaxID=112525 RepID=A0AAD8BUA7_BIOPF|nr:adenosine receptor A2a [Biomphalaria pfeifferi]